MKKLLFVLLVLLAFGLLTAVESDPSATVGYVKYNCLMGLNLIAMPMDDGVTMVGQIGDTYNAQGAGIDALSYWDAATQTWVAAVDLGYWEGDFAVAPGEVILLNCAVPFNYYSIGDMPATNAQYSILPGLNSVMVPLNRSDLTWAGSVATEIGMVDAISYWDAATQTWVAAVDLGYWEGDFPVTIGFPMQANYNGTSTTWPVGPRGETRSTSRNK